MTHNPSSVHDPTHTVDVTGWTPPGPGIERGERSLRRPIPSPGAGRDPSAASQPPPVGRVPFLTLRAAGVGHGATAAFPPGGEPVEVSERGSTKGCAKAGNGRRDMAGGIQHVKGRGG